MKQVSIDVDPSYEVKLAHGIIHQTGAYIQSLYNGDCQAKIAIISDETVASFHAQTLVESLDQVDLTAQIFTVPAGEASKSYQQLGALSSDLIQAGYDRSSLIIALGGGVVGDLAGFLAAIFYRGIPFVQIPTTIVSQVDSSVGGKTGINTPEGKNLIGAFHHPKLVLIDPDLLQTLESREYLEGFAEVVKHAAIADPQMLDELLELEPHSKDVTVDILTNNIEIKARIVEADEKETSGQRAFLNFGHTIGHAIEASVPYGELLHGEAIAIGMRAALWLSVNKTGLAQAEADKVLAVLAHFNLETILPEKLNNDASKALILKKLAYDKKFQAGKINFVLLEELGKPVLSTAVSIEDIQQAINYISQ